MGFSKSSPEASVASYFGGGRWRRSEIHCPSDEKASVEDVEMREDDPKLVQRIHLGRHIRPSTMLKVRMTKVPGSNDVNTCLHLRELHLKHRD